MLKNKRLNKKYYLYIKLKLISCEDKLDLVVKWLYSACIHLPRVNSIVLDVHEIYIKEKSKSDLQGVLLNS